MLPLHFHYRAEELENAVRRTRHDAEADRAALRAENERQDIGLRRAVVRHRIPGIGSARQWGFEKRGALNVQVSLCYSHEVWRHAGGSLLRQGRTKAKSRIGRGFGGGAAPRRSGGSCLDGFFFYRQPGVRGVVNPIDKTSMLRIQLGTAIVIRWIVVVAQR